MPLLSAAQAYAIWNSGCITDPAILLALKQIFEGNTWVTNADGGGGPAHGGPPGD